MGQWSKPKKSHCKYNHSLVEYGGRWRCHICDQSHKKTEQYRKQHTLYARTYSKTLKSQVYQKEYMKKYHNEKNRLRQREAHIRRAFGIGLDDYDKLLIEQDNKCAICYGEQTMGRRMAIDHNHLTGKVRGLLCDRCNTGLGKFKESLELLEAAKNYLIKWGGKK